VSNASRKLKQVLSEGWKIVGFQQVAEPLFEKPDGEPVALSSTGGYLILLQQAENLAVCQCSFDSIEHYIDSFHLLTEDVG
jgi:hypothetical protein